MGCRSLILGLLLLSAPAWGQPAGGGGGPAGGQQVTGSGVSTQKTYWINQSQLGSATFDKYIIGSTGIKAIVQSNLSGTPVRAEIFPAGSTNEGDASTPGTIAWAESQLTAGGEIFVNAGSYTVGTTITFDVAGITLRCADPQSTTLNAASGLNSTILRFGDFVGNTQRQGMQLMGCGLNGNPANQSTSGTLVSFRNTADARIEGNYFRYWKTLGLTIACSMTGTQCVDNMVARNDFYSSGGTGNTAGSAIFLDTATADGAGTLLSDGHITDNDIGGDNSNGDRVSGWIRIGDGTTDDTTNGWSIQGNHVYGSDRGACVEIADKTSSLIDISNNTLESCNVGAIKWKGNAAGAGGLSQIQNNKMYGFTGRCSAGTAAIGTQCTVATQTTDCGSGGVCTLPNIIDLDRVIRTIVSGNRMQSQGGGAGAFIALRDSAGSPAGSNNNFVTDNKMEMAGISGEKGIVLSNSSTNNTIANNQCRTNTGGNGTCVDGGSLGGNRFFSNSCVNVCAGVETGIAAYSSTTIHDINTSVGDVGDFTCTNGACTIDTGVVTNGKLASSYSGIGACGTNQWASTLNVNAAPTCTQPAFSNLTGTASDGQLGNSYSGVGACGANTWASTLARNAAPTCTQPDFSNISGTVTDSQHASSYSGTGACGTNTWASTLTRNAAPTCTQPNFNQLAGNQITLPGDGARLTFDLDSTAVPQQFIQFFDGTETFGGGNYYLIKMADGTYSFTNASTRLVGNHTTTTAVFDYTAAAIALGLVYTPTIQASADTTGTFVRPMVVGPAFTANNAAMTISDQPMYESSPSFSVVGTGTFGAGSAKSGFGSGVTLNSGTLAQFRHMYINDATGSGTLTTQIGLDIANLTKGGTNIGIQSASPINLIGTNGKILFDPDNSAAENFITLTDGTETVSGFDMGVVFGTGTYTLNTNTSGIFGFNAPNGMVVSYTATTNPVFGSVFNLFNAGAKIQAANGVTTAGSFGTPYAANLIFEANGAGTVMKLNAPGADYSSTPTYQVAASGTFDSASDRYGFYHKPTVGAGVTILADRAVYIAKQGGAGTITVPVGIDIEALIGSSPIGIRNASTTMYTSTGGTDPGAGFTVPVTSTSISYSPTGAARTSSTSTAINDGVQDGQILYIMNIGTTNTLTIKDNANTDFGGADCVLNRGGVLHVIWNLSESNWLKVACSVN